MSNYPPGVTGNEPQISGEWPCPICQGAGGDVDFDGETALPQRCWFCNGSGKAPEDPPRCPACGDQHTDFIETLVQQLTQPQQKILNEALLTGGKLTVRGTRHTTALNLERAGFGHIRVGGSGIPYKGRWWWQLELGELGTKSVNGHEHIYCHACGEVNP